MSDVSGRKSTIGIALIILGLLLLLSLGLSSRGFDFQDIVVALQPRPEDLSSALRYDIVMHLRAPRVICATLVGVGLAVAGVAFQGVFRNPLADPYIIGSSSGAALGAALAVVLSSKLALAGLTPLGFAALIGAVVVVFIVFAIGKVVGSTSSLTLLLCGIAISSLANALVSLMLYLHNRDAVATIVTWMMGSFADSNWNNVLVMAITVVVATAVVWGASRKLDAYSLGDRTAQTLGLSVQSLQIQILLAASLLTAFAVASSGIIGFVGLIAPQLARMFIGVQHAKLVPLSAVLGGILLVTADSVARVVIAPVELPVGIVTALIGAPFFLVLLLRSARSGTGAGSHS